MAGHPCCWHQAVDAGHTLLTVCRPDAEVEPAPAWVLLASSSWGAGHCSFPGRIYGNVAPHVLPPSTRTGPYLDKFSPKSHSGAGLRASQHTPMLLPLCMAPPLSSSGQGRSGAEYTQQRVVPQPPSDSRPDWQLNCKQLGCHCRPVRHAPSLRGPARAPGEGCSPLWPIAATARGQGVSTTVLFNLAEFIGM